MRSFFRLSVFVASFALAISVNNLSAQRFRLGKPTAPPPAPATSPTIPPAATPAPTTPTPATPAEPATPGITEERVREIAAGVAAEKVGAIRIPPPVDLDRHKADVIKAVNDGPIAAVNARLDRVDRGMTFFVIILVVLVFGLFVGAYFAYRRLQPPPSADAGGPGAGGVATRVALMLLVAMFAASSVFAAPVVTSCRTAAGEPAFFANDGSTSDVVCRVSGLTAATAVTFADPGITTSAVTLSGSQLKFKLTVGTGVVVPAEPDMSVDGTVVGHPIAVLDVNDAGRMDLTLRYLRGGFVSGDLVAREFIRGLVDAACEGGTQCNREETFKALFGPKKGSSRQAGYIVGTASRKGAVEAALGDPRLKEVISAGVTGGIEAYFKTNPPAAPVDLGPLTERVTTVEAAVSAAQTAANVLNTRVTEGEKDLSVVREAAAELREQLNGARIPRRGPLGLVGATRPLVKK